MHEIVVLSGKGGAGKTSVTAALARAMSAREKIVVCDYDVDAPDLHILLRPETEMSADFVSGHLAVFNSDNCIDCAQCLAFCRFDAIKQAAPCEYPVIEQLCEGCAVCVKLCPELAFDFVPRHCGEYYRSRTRFGTMIHAELTPGAENSGRLILLLKQEAAKAAQADGAEIILSDGTPGIGCPVISSLSGAGLVCAVIEAGASGIADFKRLAELARRFRLPIAVIVNKADLSAEATEAAMQAARDAGAEVLGTLPFTPVFTEAMSRGEAVGETPSVKTGVNGRVPRTSAPASRAACMAASVASALRSALLTMTAIGSLKRRASSASRLKSAMPEAPASMTAQTRPAPESELMTGQPMPGVPSERMISAPSAWAALAASCLRSRMRRPEFSAPGVSSAWIIVPKRVRLR